MKNNIIKLLIVLLLGLGLLSFSFYWYELRPINIKKDCAQQVSNMWNDRKDTIGFDDILDAQRYFDMYYATCLHKSGI